MEVQDRSVVQPVLRAIESLGAYPQQLDIYYRIVDQFCGHWLGVDRGQADLRDDAALYLIHDLLGEYLRFEGNHRRVALWLLALNRCCSNYGRDLSAAREELDSTLRESDLALDQTLLEPIYQKVEEYERSHRSAAASLGQDDALGSFLQWVGIYCTYIYPTLMREGRTFSPTLISSLTFLIREFIRLRSNVSRMAALLLSIQEACAIGAAAREPAGFAEPCGSIEPCGFERPQPADAGAPVLPERSLPMEPVEEVRAGQDERTVEAILERLRSEGRREPPPDAGDLQALKALLREGLALPLPDLEAGFGRALERVRAAAGSSPEAAREVRRMVEAGVDSLNPRAVRVLRQIEESLAGDFTGATTRFLQRASASPGRGGKLLSRLLLLGAARHVLRAASPGLPPGQALNPPGTAPRGRTAGPS